MTRTLTRLGALVVFALALTAAGLTSGAGALASSVGPTKIGPHQFFGGLVNGVLQGATVKVVCPGPASVGRALPGQTLAVMSPQVIARNFGNTGAKGRAIAANVGPTSSGAVTIIFTKYNHPAAFPTDIPVPCSGTGVIVFNPLPGSHGSAPATVTVTYANVATNG
jgi:hypothetical protein